MLEGVPRRGEGVREKNNRTPLAEGHPLLAKRRSLKEKNK